MQPQTHQRPKGEKPGKQKGLATGASQDSTKHQQSSNMKTRNPINLLRIQPRIRACLGRDAWNKIPTRCRKTASPNPNRCRDLGQPGSGFPPGPHLLRKSQGRGCTRDWGSLARRSSQPERPRYPLSTVNHHSSHPTLCARFAHALKLIKPNVYRGPHGFTLCRGGIPTPLHSRPVALAKADRSQPAAVSNPSALNQQKPSRNWTQNPPPRPSGPSTLNHQPSTIYGSSFRPKLFQTTRVVPNYMCSSELHV